MKQSMNQIYQFLEKRELKDALYYIKLLTNNKQEWKLTNRLNDLVTNYRYMLHYMIEGNKDPEQHRIYIQLIRDIYTLADDMIENIEQELSSDVFYAMLRKTKNTTSISMREFGDLIIEQSERLSLIDLIKGGKEKEKQIMPQLLDYENTQQVLFNTIFLSPRANNDFISDFQQFMTNEAIPVPDKSIAISALMLNLLQRFDILKIDLLIELSNHPNMELAIRAITAIIPIFQLYNQRLSLYPTTIDRLNLLSDDPIFTRRFVTAIISFIEARETEKISKILADEIFSKIDKINPLVSEKINMDEWMGESGINEKNPEWENILKESGLADKLQRFDELQVKGADVFHSTFANLKSYPFFRKISNWFLPFNTQNSAVRSLFTGLSKKSTFADNLTKMPIVCNSDKYSFCLSLLLMPTGFWNKMFSNVTTESKKLAKMDSEELKTNPFKKEQTIQKQYTQDIYRFFKASPEKNSFIDIFTLPLDFHKIPALQPIIISGNNLETIALFYFEKNNFKEALEVYTMLSEKDDSRSEVWQKIGFCRQILSDFKGALEAYLHADLIQENNTWVINRIAHCYRLLKDPVSALQYYRRLEQLHPDDSNIQLKIGHCYLEQGEYEKALNYYFKVEVVDTNNIQAWRSIAWCAFRSLKFDLAKKYYTKILARNPNEHDFLNSGHVALCQGEMKEAVTLYKRSYNKTDSFDSFRSMFTNDTHELEYAGVNPEIIPPILDIIKFDFDIQENKKTDHRIKS